MSQDLWTTLDAFRKTHPAKRATWNGKSYTYLVGGEAKQTIFLFPGGLGIGEPFFLHMLDLEKAYKVIAPSYPDIESLDDLVAGMHHIAETEGVTRYSVVGQSAGGLVAQVLVRKFPQHVEKVVLSHTSAVTKATSEEEIATRVVGMKKRLRLLRWMPFIIVKNKLMKSIDRIVKTIRPEELYFWREYFEYVFAMRTKRDQIAMMNMLIDFALYYRFTPNDLDAWPGRIIILDSESDASIPQSERENVRKLYPSAEVHTFEDFGHLAILSERETYLRLIRTFLEN